MRRDHINTRLFITFSIYRLTMRSNLLFHRQKRIRDGKTINYWYAKDRKKGVRNFYKVKSNCGNIETRMA